MTSAIHTTHRDDAAAPATSWRARPRIDLLASQLSAVDAWHAARPPAADAAIRQSVSRETRMDLTRRDEIVRREHDALVAHVDGQLRDHVASLTTAPAPRAVVAHRSDWYRDVVVKGLLAGGVNVVARLDNGADVVGVVVAEQPDLLFVEDKLQMVGGPEALRRALRFSPLTLAAAQVCSDHGIAEVLEAGACTAFTRRVPPADVAVALTLLLQA